MRVNAAEAELCQDGSVAFVALILMNSPSEPNREWIEMLVSDMTRLHVALPRGVTESLDWRTRPRIAWGNRLGEGWNAMMPWGQVYLREGRTMPANTRVEIRNLQTWIRSRRTGEWTRRSGSRGVEGANYREDFVDDASIPADHRSEPSGGTSVTVPAGHNYHFWVTSGRVQVDPEDIGGLFSTVEARLIPDDLGRPWTPDPAAVMMSVGADWWKSVDAAWDQWKTNGDAAIGRFRFITPQWTTYTAHTLSEEEIRRNPPPRPEAVPQ